MRSSDNLGTVRDLAEYDDATDTTAIVDHYVYDAFGNETDHTGSNDFLFKYTGRAFDDETRLQNNLNRWFDPTVGRWLSEDPIRFAGDPANLYRYVGNSVTGFVDPSGLQALIPNFVRAVRRGVKTYSTNKGQLQIVTMLGNSPTRIKDSRTTAMPIYMRFVPNGKCICDDIVFVQVARSMTNGKVVYPQASLLDDDVDTIAEMNAKDKKLAKYYSQFDTAENWAVDHTIGEDDPYVNARWSQKDNRWVSRDEGATRTGFLDDRSLLGNGQSRTPAQMFDSPKKTPRQSGAFEAETAVVCRSTGEVLAVVRWGFTIGQQKHEKTGQSVWVTTRTGLTQDDFSTELSPQFRAAIDKWNQVARKKGFHPAPPSLGTGN